MRHLAAHSECFLTPSAADSLTWNLAQLGKGSAQPHCILCWHICAPQEDYAADSLHDVLAGAEAECCECLHSRQKQAGQLRRLQQGDTSNERSAALFGAAGNEEAGLAACTPSLAQG